MNSTLQIAFIWNRKCHLANDGAPFWSAVDRNLNFYSKSTKNERPAQALIRSLKNPGSSLSSPHFVPTSNFRRYSHSSRQSGNYRIIGADINVSTSRVILKPFTAISSPCVRTFFFTTLNFFSLFSLAARLPFSENFCKFSLLRFFESSHLPPQSFDLAKTFDANAKADISKPFIDSYRTRLIATISYDSCCLSFESTRSKKKKYFVAQKWKYLAPKRNTLRHLKSRSVIFVPDKFPVFRFRISGAVFLGREKPL